MEATALSFIVYRLSFILSEPQFPHLLNEGSSISLSLSQEQPETPIRYEHGKIKSITQMSVPRIQA